MSSVLYFDCQSGISGDMAVGALLDLGIDREAFASQLTALNVPGFHVQITQTRVSGILATDFEVVLAEARGPQHHAHHRNLGEIEAIIERSELAGSVKDLSVRVFRCLAEAEARVHRLSLEEVHFHEVGAVDSIADIVGAAICVSMLDAERVLCSPLRLGSGFTRCSHGVIPIPSPATVEILKGVPVSSGDVEGELVTPTGAAIVKTLAEDFVSLPAIRMDAIGYGRGKKNYGIPNILRVYLGRPEPEVELAASGSQSVIVSSG